MSAPVLVPCLVTLRAEFNTIAPSRDRASDGWIGDPAHQSRASDHNPDSRGLVHAIDVDKTGPWPGGFSMAKAVETIVLRQRSGVDQRLQNVIFDRRIWSRSWGWTARTYTGSNPHDKHAHFSARYTPALEQDTRPWELLDERHGDEVLVRKGDTGENVKFWQNILVDLGYNVGQVDGNYGPQLEAAVNAYRKAKGLGPLGYVSGWTGFALLRDLAVKHASAGPRGPQGPAGPPGPPGPAGKDGALTGTLTVTGGHLEVDTSST